jgi:heme-degrading monooxygenase HmoA
MPSENADAYLAIAAELKEHLARSPGFIRSERFASLSSEGKILSLSVWQDEDAVRAWRNQFEHRAGQRRGRDELFTDYTITVVSPLRSYGPADRREAPEDSEAFFGSSG